MLISTVFEYSASEVDGEMDSRGSDLEDESCVGVSISGTVTRGGLRLGNGEEELGCNGTGGTRRVTIASL